MNYNLGELESLFYDIQSIIDYIENSNFEGRKFSMFLCNGEILNYKLFNDHIPHLLGIDTSALLSTGLFSNRSSFELLKEMVSDPYKIHKLASEGIIRYENIFSEFIMDKIKVFESNISPNIYETEFICKYESSRSYVSTTNTLKYDYILVKKIKNTDNYACLCFVNNGKYYGARSSMYFQTKEDMQAYLEEHIKNQEITILNGVRSVGDFGDYNRTFNLKPDYILGKLEKLEEYRDTFNCIINTNKGYIYSLRETLKHMDKHYDNNSLLSELVNAISDGKIIDRNKFIGSNLIDIVDANNDYLCSTNNDNKDISISYTEVTKERDTLRNELLAMKTEVEKLNKEKLELINENKEIKEMNEDYKSREEAMLRILKPGS